MSGEIRRRRVEKFQPWIRVTPVPPRYRLGRTLEYLLVPRGGSKNFSKGRLYTIVVTFKANGVDGE